MAKEPVAKVLCLDERAPAEHHIVAPALESRRSRDARVPEERPRAFDEELLFRKPGVWPSVDLSDSHRFEACEDLRASPSFREGFEVSELNEEPGRYAVRLEPGTVLFVDLLEDLDGLVWMARARLKAREAKGRADPPGGGDPIGGRQSLESVDTLPQGAADAANRSAASTSSGSVSVSSVARVARPRRRGASTRPSAEIRNG